MKSKRSLVLAAAGLAALVLLVLAWRQSRRASEAEEKSAAARAALVEARAEISRNERRVREVAAREQAVRAAMELQRRRQGANVPLPPHYATNPDLVHAAYRPLVRRYLAGFQAAAGISPEQAEAFEAAVATRLGPWMEGFLMAEAISPQHPDAAANLESSAIGPVAELARAMLGDGAAVKAEELLRGRELRRAINAMAAYTLGMESPLNAGESERLIDLMRAAAPRGTTEKLTLTALDWEEVMSRAAGFLAPAQIKALEALRAKAAFDREYERVTGFPMGAVLPEPER